MEVRVNLHCTKLTNYWLISKLGSPIVLSRSTHYGKYIISFLNKTGSRYKPTNYDHTLPLIIPSDMFSRNGFYLSSDAQREINSFVRNYVYEMFFSQPVFLENLTNLHKYKMKEIIQAFCHAHDLPESVLAFETMKRNWNRAQNKPKPSDSQSIRKLLDNLSLNPGQNVPFNSHKNNQKTA